MHRFYPPSLFPDLWQMVDRLIIARKLFSHEVVFKEIVPEHGKKDGIASWAERQSKIFLPVSLTQINLLSRILGKFPRLIDPDLEKDQADPWLIACLIEMMDKEGLFGADSSYALVSMEKIDSSEKLPAACRYFNIEHRSLFEFFKDLNVQFITRDISRSEK
jgi:hypothetical protein